MKTTWYSLSLLSAIALILFPISNSYLVAADVQLVAQTAQYSFEDYKRECLQRATREGLARDVADDLCNCTINKFRSRYTIQQFRALVQKSKQDKAAARTLSSVGEACFDEVLYEE